MSMQNHYAFNVSLSGKHLFATSAHSATDFKAAERIAKELHKRFPESEGFLVKCTFWEVGGSEVIFDMEVPKDRYFVRVQGFLDDTQCVVVRDDNTSYLILDGGVKGFEGNNFSLSYCLGRVASGAWLEFTSREG